MEPTRLLAAQYGNLHGSVGVELPREAVLRVLAPLCEDFRAMDRLMET